MRSLSQSPSHLGSCSSSPENSPLRHRCTLSMLNVLLFSVFIASQAFSFQTKTLPVPGRRITFKMTRSGNEIPQQYPLSRKSVKKSALISISSKVNSQKKNYTPIGWSNRIGTVLTPVATPGVYTADRPFYWNKIDVGCRMTVILLPTETNGKPDLFLHSPVAVSEALREACDELGHIKHVASPNYEHVKYAKGWRDAYPDAKFWGCPGLAERESNVDWNAEVSAGMRPDGYDAPSTPGRLGFDIADVEAMHFDVEVNPFTGRPFFNEVVFYHRPSKTLLVTDTYWNYPRKDGVTNADLAAMVGSQEEDEDGDFGVWALAPEVGPVPFGSWLWKQGMDRVYRPFFLNLMIKPDQKAEYEKMIHHMINVWDVETLIPAHGDVIRGKQSIQKVLARHFNVGLSI